MTLAKRGRRDSNGKDIGGDEYDQVPDGDENGELDGAQLCQAKSAAAARPGLIVNNINNFYKKFSNEPFYKINNFSGLRCV